MKETGKSLGQFLADVLSNVGTATYIPAGVLVGGVSLIGLLHTSSASNPLAAVTGSTTPTFAELALTVVIVALVAALLEPMQVGITRVCEGYVPGEWKAARKRFVKKRSQLESKRDAARISRDELTSELADDSVKPERYKELRDQIDIQKALIRQRSLELREWPEDDWRILPTRLGNLVRAYEDQANALLSEITDQTDATADIQALLPFAHFAIPDATMRVHDRFRGQLTSATSLILILPLLGAGLVVVLGTATWWAAGTGAITLFLTATAYVGARGAARGYGQMLLAIARQYHAGAFSVQAQAVEADQGKARAG